MKSKKILIPILTLSVCLIISIIANITLAIENKNYKETISLKYISLYTTSDQTMINIELRTEKQITLRNDDFAILINNMPKEALSIYCHDEYNDRQSLEATLHKNTNITIYFNYNINTIQNPTILYKGQELKLGKELTFKI